MIQLLLDDLKIELTVFFDSEPKAGT